MRRSTCRWARKSLDRAIAARRPRRRIRAGTAWRCMRLRRRSACSAVASDSPIMRRNSVPMPGKKRFGVAAADGDQADAGQRQQRGRLHFLGAHAVQQRVLLRLQAAAQRLAVGQAIAERLQARVVLRDDLQPVGVAQAVDRLEQHQPHQVAVEILGQAGGHRAQRVGGAVLAHQRQRELVRAHRQALVLLRVGEQLLQAPRQLAVLVAQHFQLVAGQRRGRAFLARHHQGQRQVGELLQEARMPAQPGGDFVRAELFLRLVHGSTPLRTRMRSARTSSAARRRPARRSAVRRRAGRR